jgi:adenosine kinase
MLHGLPWPIAGRVGALAATFVLESIGTQSHAFTPLVFLDRYAAAFGETPPELRSVLTTDLATAEPAPLG